MKEKGAARACAGRSDLDQDVKEGFSEEAFREQASAVGEIERERGGSEGSWVAYGHKERVL